MAVFDNLKEIVNITANRALISDANGRVAASSTITTTELGYLNGVTSNIQTQLNDKVTNNFSTKNAALYVDANGKVVASGSVNATELGHLDGVTSNIQTQLNSKYGAGSQPLFSGIGIGASGTQAYIYSENENVNFRYKDANGNIGYNNLRNIPSCTVSGTTLNITLG